MNKEKRLNGQEEQGEKAEVKATSFDGKVLDPEYLYRLYNRHFQGALVRSGASVFMWSAALAAFLIGVINRQNFLGVSASVLFLIFMNPPTLWILKRTKRKKSFEFWSLSINFLEIIAYTAIIYSLGGTSSLWLSTIYAAVITYVAVVGPPRFPFLMAGACALSLSFMVIMEFLGLIPPMDPFWETPLPGRSQMVIVVSSIGLLFVVAFISSYTSSLMKKHRTKLRNQDVKLNQSRTELKLAAEEIAERNVELQEALNKARESVRMKSQFLANMSHELRTPLNHIIGFTELLVDKRFGEINKAQEEYLNDMLGSSRHLLSLINDILDLSKVEAGKMSLELSQIDLRALLENSLTMVKERAQKHGIRISLNLDTLPKPIRGDERKLRQVMYNLLSNAVKFTPDGGAVEVAAEILVRGNEGWTRRNGEIVLRMPGNIREVEKANWLQVSVADTGVGLRQENLEKIFEPFEQVDAAANRRYQGTGLGLSLSKGYVTLHGGKIWAESQGEGKGSCFHFTLPF